MEPNNDTQESKKPSKYGKRPLWQWIVLYVVVAVIVYFIVYLLFFHSHTGNSGY
jgi:flagellar basal body-associated protein FliL